jgi:hypothetical protein
MRARTRIVVAVSICAVSVGASLSLLSSAVGAASVPSISGVWLAYSPASTTTPIWTFVLNNKPGSTRVTGSWQTNFVLVGTVAAASGVAMLDAGVQPGTLATMNFTVKFVFKSNSTAQTNHPTFRGTFDDVTRATGVAEPNSQGTVRAIRCSYQTTAKAIAFCG